MILVDANILIYAHATTFQQHTRAREWLDTKLSGHERVGLPWSSLLAFLRIVTNPRVFEKPESIDDACQQVVEWLDCRVSWIPEPTTEHAEVLRRMLSESGAQGNLIPDAHLAALAVEHGLTLCSSDCDFSRFPDLLWHNPLVS